MDERSREEDSSSPSVTVDAGREDRFHEKIQESRKIAQDYVAELEEKRNKMCQDLGVSRATMEQVSVVCHVERSCADFLKSFSGKQNINSKRQWDEDQRLKIIMISN